MQDIAEDPLIYLGQDAGPLQSTNEILRCGDGTILLDESQQGLGSGDPA